MKLTAKLALLAMILGTILPSIQRWAKWNDELNNCENGTLVSLIVGSMPFMSPFIYAKDILIPDAVEGYLVAMFMHLMVPPAGSFNESMFGEPNYSDEALTWNALPHTKDTGDIVPFHCGDDECTPENQRESETDLFFIGPSTHYSPTTWNADWNSSNTKYMNREAIIPQQAAIFNSVARVFSPQIRQMSGFGYLAAEKETDGIRVKAADIAYRDVRNAFRHYVRNYNPDLRRGIFLAGHSQGAEYLLRLLRDEFSVNTTVKKSLVAAYIIGMPVYKSVLKEIDIPVCSSPDQIGCVITWQTYVDGADPSHFYFEPTEPKFRKLQVGEKPSAKILAERVCVNPLSWEADSPKYIDRKKNKGGMHIVQLLQNYYFLAGPPNPGNNAHERQLERIQQGLLPLKKHIVGARCIGGSLYVDDPPYGEMGSNPLYMVLPVWRFGAFPGSNLHPYDFNFFWADIRANAEERARAYIRKRGAAEST